MINTLSDTSDFSHDLPTLDGAPSEREFPVELLQAPIDTRLDFFKKEVFVEHLLLMKVLDEVLEAVINPSDKLLLLVCGAPGIGKTTLIKALRKRLKKRAASDPTWDVGRIAAVTMTLVAYNNAIFNWRDFYVRLLKEMAEILLPYKMVFDESTEIKYGSNVLIIEKAATASTLSQALEKAIKNRRPQAFAFDEAHHLLKLARGTQAVDQMETLKSLVDTTRTPTVLVGIHKLIEFAGVSGQLDRRMTIFQFERYHGSNEDHVQAFQEVLHDFLSQMPLEVRPDLDDRWDLFFEMSFGEIGLLKDWLYDSLKHVLINGKPKLTWEICKMFAPPQNLIDEIVAGEKAYAEYKGRIQDADEKLKLRNAIRAATGLSPLDGSADDSEPHQGTNNGNQPGKADGAPKGSERKPGERNPKRDTVGLP